MRNIINLKTFIVILLVLSLVNSFVILNENYTKQKDNIYPNSSINEEIIKFGNNVETKTTTNKDNDRDNSNNPSENNQSNINNYTSLIQKAKNFNPFLYLNPNNNNTIVDGGNVIPLSKDLSSNYHQIKENSVNSDTSHTKDSTIIKVDFNENQNRFKNNENENAIDDDEINKISLINNSTVIDNNYNNSNDNNNFNNNNNNLEKEKCEFCNPDGIDIDNNNRNENNFSNHDNDNEKSLNKKVKVIYISGLVIGIVLFFCNR